MATKLPSGSPSDLIALLGHIRADISASGPGPHVIGTIGSIRAKHPSPWRQIGEWDQRDADDLLALGNAAGMASAWRKVARASRKHSHDPPIYYFARACLRARHAWRARDTRITSRERVARFQRVARDLRKSAKALGSDDYFRTLGPKPPSAMPLDLWSDSLLDELARCIWPHVDSNVGAAHVAMVRELSPTIPQMLARLAELCDEAARLRTTSRRPSGKGAERAFFIRHLASELSEMFLKPMHECIAVAASAFFGEASSDLVRKLTKSESGTFPLRIP